MAEPARHHRSLLIRFKGEALRLEGRQAGHVDACALRISVPLANPMLLPKQPLLVDIHYFEQAGTSAGQDLTAELHAFVNGRSARAQEDPRSGDGRLRFELNGPMVAAQGGLDILLLAVAARPNVSGTAVVGIESIEVDCPRRGAGGCWPAPPPPATPEVPVRALAKQPQ